MDGSPSLNDGSMWRSRRLKRFMVDEQEVLDLLLRGMTPQHGFIYVAKEFPFPLDARVLSVHHDWREKCFGFTIEHESFPEVPDGGLIPAVPWGRMWSSAVRIADADEPVTVEGR